jgi:small subunit ribosomal protein S20
MAVGAIPPPLFFERRRSDICCGHGILREASRQPIASIGPLAAANGAYPQIAARDRRRRIFESMANTTSAKKATRKIARRTIVNKSRRTQMRGAVRTVEEAIKKGDRDAALKAMAHAEPQLMRAAQRNIIHKNNASRKVSRLSHQIAKLAK